MKPCKHKYLSFLDYQETYDGANIIPLCRCQHCGLTLIIPSKYILSYTGSIFINKYKQKGKKHEHH